MSALPQATGGTLYGHLFENPRIGVPRNIYWAINVELEPLRLDDEDWDCSVGLEWIAAPVRSWADLDGLTLAGLSDPEGLEASAYILNQHCPADIASLVLKRIEGSARFELELRGAVSVEEPGLPSQLTIDLKTVLDLTGVVVIPENLAPKPSEPSEVKAAVAAFLSTADLCEPVRDGLRFLLKPAN